MSYSRCISCVQLVPGYEKYCANCLNNHPQLKQVADFWQNYYYTWDAAHELAKQELSEPAARLKMEGE